MEKEKNDSRYTPGGLPVVTDEVYIAFFKELERMEDTTKIVDEWCKKLAEENPVIAQYILDTYACIPEEFKKRAYLSTIGVYKLLESQIGNIRAEKLWRIPSGKN